MALMNDQTVNGTTSAYTGITGSTTGVSLTTASSLTGTAAVDSNMLLAIASGASATNSLSVAGMSLTGLSVPSSGALLQTSTANSTSNSLGQGNASNMSSLLNSQDRLSTGGVTSTITGAQTAATFGGLVTGSASVSNNVIAAQSRGLAATNTLGLSADTSTNGGVTVLGSTQYSASGSSATINTGTISLTANGGATNGVTGTASVNGNTSMADATSNLAINSLTSSATTGITNFDSASTATNLYSLGAAGSTTSTSTAVGFALQNTQVSSGNTGSSINNMNITNSLAASTALNGTATVDNNTVLSQARGQVAQNSLSLNAGTDLTASASLANIQVQSGSISSNINGLVGSTGSIALNAPTTGVAGTASVSNNTVQASAVSNLALNSMTLNGKLGLSTGGSTGTMTGTADYVALNTQANSGSVTSGVSNFTIGYNTTGAATSTSGTASVLNNSILASATANSASNTYTIAATGGTGANTADFAFTGNQSNTGAVTSTVGGARIQVASLGASGSFSAGGNRIGSSAMDGCRGR
jgi:hypothetical protein